MERCLLTDFAPVAVDDANSYLMYEIGQRLLLLFEAWGATEPLPLGARPRDQTAIASPKTGINGSSMNGNGGRMGTGPVVLLCICKCGQDAWLKRDRHRRVVTFEKQLKFSLSEPNFYKTLISLGRPLIQLPSFLTSHLSFWS